MPIFNKMYFQLIDYFILLILLTQFLSLLFFHLNFLGVFLFFYKKVEGKEEDSEVERWGERTTSVDISDDAMEHLDVGALERHQMERRRLQAKQQHSERRKAWLRKNQALLRVFLSYCSLHGAKGGGVTSVRMELLFLLQESQQVHIPLIHVAQKFTENHLKNLSSAKLSSSCFSL